MKASAYNRLTTSAGISSDEKTTTPDTRHNSVHMGIPHGSHALPGAKKNQPPTPREEKKSDLDSGLLEPMDIVRITSCPAHNKVTIEKLNRSKRKQSVLLLNKNDSVVITRCNDKKPLVGRNYFSQQSQESKQYKGGLSVVIPFYNEPAWELCETLKSLYNSYSYLIDNSEAWAHRSFNVCIIQDGWYKAHETMKQFIKKMYFSKVQVRNGSDSIPRHNSIESMNESVSGGPGLGCITPSYMSGNHYRNISNEVSVHWWDYFEEFSNYNPKQHGKHVTFIVEKHLDTPLTYFDCIEQDPNFKMHLTLIIKIDNRKKHNSHEWFMGKYGYVDAFKPRYFFTTDAFTKFDQVVLYELVKYLDYNENCCGVTGRQRVMNRDMQHRRRIESRCSIEYLLRLTQQYDFELAGCVFNPTYHFIGFLPVLPGPCGLYRTKDVTRDEARGWYFKIVNQNPSETGLILGNLKIAEDRILSYASILKPKHPTKTHRNNLCLAYCRKAIFYFEAETNMEGFIAQRRRWINGTYAGYVFLVIKEPWHVFNWNANIFKKFMVYLILVLNLIQMSAMIISPALSMVIFHTSIEFLLRLKSPNSYKTWTDITMTVCCALWVVHVFIHNTKKFSVFLVQFLFVISVIISLTVFVALFLQIGYFRMYRDKYDIDDAVIKAIKINQMSTEMEWGIIYLMLYAIISPFINSLLVDRGGIGGFLAILKTMMPFYLAFYLMIPWFSSYSFARCWDLTWGNRPGKSDLEENNRLQSSARSGLAPGGLILQNSNNNNKSNSPRQQRIDRTSFLSTVTDTVGDIDIPHNQEHIEVMQKTQAKFKRLSQWVCFFLVCINAFVFLFLSLYQQALLMAGILLATALFMFIAQIGLLFDIIWDIIAFILCCKCPCFEIPPCFKCCQRSICFSNEEKSKFSFKLKEKEMDLENQVCEHRQRRQKSSKKNKRGKGKGKGKGKDKQEKSQTLPSFGFASTSHSTDLLAEQPRM